MPVTHARDASPDTARDAAPGTDSERSRVRWVDNHCHLDGEQDPAAVVAAAREAGVEALVTVGTDAARSAVCLDLADRLENVWATAGLHPHDAVQGVDELLKLVDDALGPDRRRLVAIGECGLDYHYDHSPREVQRRVFAAQVVLAREVDLPLVIHTREAWDDTFAILEEHGVPERTVFHCFTGGPQEAALALDLGAMLSVSGIVTFRSAGALREAVAATPLERLLVETDSPYLAPVPHRGERNRPSLVGRVGEELAALHGRPVGEVAEATTLNAVRFYGLDLGDRPDGGGGVDSG